MGLKDLHSPSEKTLAAIFVRKRLDLARQASPILSHQSYQSSPSGELSPSLDKPLHLEAFIKSLGVFSVSSLVLMLSSLILMCAFFNSNSNNSSITGNRFSSQRKSTKANLVTSLTFTNTTNGGRDIKRVLEDTRSFLQSKGHDAELLGDLIGDNTEDGRDLRDNGLLGTGVALMAYVLVASLTCFLVCSMQCFFVSKVLDLTDGYDRAYKYICVCSRTRTLAITGLVTAIPVFVAGVVVFLMSKESSTQFTTGTIFCVLGGIVCIVCALHNFYYWRQEKTRSDLGLPVYDSQGQGSCKSLRNLGYQRLLF
ncbi:hypothetical protein EGW08_002759 [Elysia chlorotica]|uniref:Transmembrane protein n=1 Tax=Elysia chlorotica TaxID=188477 RepID=A0A3S1BR18_ELYCH|nr:hypothetical protein EGW08_002759 [Elysia chlorotica]